MYSCFASTFCSYVNPLKLAHDIIQILQYFYIIKIPIGTFKHEVACKIIYLKEYSSAHLKEMMPHEFYGARIKLYSKIYKCK